MTGNNGDQATEQAVDDRGTSESQGRMILTRLRDNGFAGSDEKLAVALGRPLKDVQGWTAGTEAVDDDVVMKARGIAKERGISVE